jgi:hypothetical protein
MKRKLALVKSSSVTPAKPGAKGLLTEVREMILATRQTVAQGINSALVLLCWKIGQRIRADILKEKRASYGEKIFYALSRKLTAEFGNGFSQANLFHMARFAEVFPDPKIVHALSGQLSWTHLRRIIYLDDPLKRDFYAEMCRIERWNTRTLHEKIQSMLFERTALSKKPAKLMAIDLKIGDFEAADKGQMELYLNWLKRHECEPGEAEPLGMILCAGKTAEHVELLELEKSGIRVASYWTKVLPKKQLERKLHEAVRLARARLAESRTATKGGE